MLALAPVSGQPLPQEKVWISTASSRVGSLRSATSSENAMMKRWTELQVEFWRMKRRLPRHRPLPDRLSRVFLGPVQLVPPPLEPKVNDETWWAMNVWLRPVSPFRVVQPGPISCATRGRRRLQGHTLSLGYEAITRWEGQVEVLKIYLWWSQPEPTRNTRATTLRRSRP